MKKVLIILTIILLLGLAGGFYYFLVYKPSQETDSALTTRDQDTQQKDSEESESEDSSCPEGVVCIGGSEVANLPTIELGVNQVYAAEEETSDSDSSDQEEQEEEEYESPKEVKANTPLQVAVTNKDYKIWSVAWVTESAQTGYINYGTDAEQISKEAFDDRETGTSNLKERYTHHVTITNTEEELSQEDLTYYFNIVSAEEEFKNGNEPYSYQNAPLTSSPSTPNSVTISSSVNSFEREDFIVIASQKSSSGDESSLVSDYFNDTGGAELIIGIAREQDLESYFPYSTSNRLQIKLYGPGGYTGLVDSVSLSSLKDEVLSIQTKRTGYEGDMYTVANSTDYALQEAQESPIPSTAIGDSLLYNSLFGVLISLFGACSLLLLFYLNYRKIWEVKVVKKLESKDA